MRWEVPGFYCLERRFAFATIPQDVSLLFVPFVHGEYRIDSKDAEQYLFSRRLLASIQNRLPL